MCKTNDKYVDFLTGSPTTVTVNALLSPNASYFWEITDSFGNTYNQAFDTDADGYGEIDITALPEGFINPYMGEFIIRVKESLSDCDYVEFAMVQRYRSIVVENKKGNTSKSWIGCTISNTIRIRHTELVPITLTEDDDTVQSDELKSDDDTTVSILLCLIGGVETDFDWDDPAVFEPSTGTHHLGGAYPAETKIKYLINKS
jgi:hypothetical protein